MVKQIVISVLLSVCLSVKAQEGTPRPSFFEEERRLATPTNQEIQNDRQSRKTGGFSETFLTDALNAVSDPGEGTESRSAFNTTAIDPRNPNPPAPPLGIFTRPPSGDASGGIFSRPPGN